MRPDDEDELDDEPSTDDDPGGLPSGGITRFVTPVPEPDDDEDEG